MKSANVLLVEDEAVVALDMKNRLEDLGHRVVDIVSYADQAPEAARRHSPELVIMDIRTPGSMDGIDAAVAIRSALDLPVVFLTACADAYTVSRATAAGPHAYLVKPVQDHDLYATLEVVLVQAGLSREISESRNNLALRVRELDTINKVLQSHLNEQFEVADAFSASTSWFREIERDLTAALDEASVALAQSAESLEKLRKAAARHTAPDYDRVYDSFRGFFREVLELEHRVNEAVARARTVQVPDFASVMDDLHRATVSPIRPRRPRRAS